MPDIPWPETRHYISGNVLIGNVTIVSHGKDLLKRLDVTFWLQVALLATASALVQAAGWMESPPLILFAFLAALTAILLVNLGKYRKGRHLWAILAGVLLAYESGVYLTEADQWYLRFGELHSRLGQWWSVMIQEHSSTDTLPLSITVIAITWVTAYFTSWALFRHRNVWAAFLLVGTATGINLTYLPERYLIYIYMFLFVSLIMLVHMTGLSQRTLLACIGMACREVRPTISMVETSALRGHIPSAPVAETTAMGAHAGGINSIAFSNCAGRRESGRSA